MRIVIDMQGAQTGSRFRGIGRYTMALAKAMVRHRGNHEVILILNGMFSETLLPIRQAFQGLLPKNQILVWNAQSPVCPAVQENMTRLQIAEAIREDFINGLNPDVLHITSFFEGFSDNAVHSIKKHKKKYSNYRIAVTFYDAIPMLQHKVYLDPHPKFKNFYCEKIEQIKNADLLLSISESSKREAINYLNFPCEQVCNISAAVDDNFRPSNFSKEEIFRFKEQLGIRDRFIMYSGATDDRKNHIGLISAYAMLPEDIRKTYQLVLVGGLPIDHEKNFKKHIKKCDLNENDVIITGRVSDETMTHAYSICDLYVFPSWHEGFGLPVLEAMSCGAPVIGSNTTSVPEVIGFERALFDPHSPQSIADKIQEALSDPIFLKQLKNHARVQAAKFSWDESAKRAINAFEKLVSIEKNKLTPARRNTNQKHNNLITDISNIISDNKKNINLLDLCQSMAMNVRGEQRQLLVDVSGLIQCDFSVGIRRVVLSILRELLNETHRPYDLRLVYADKLFNGYRYANRFTKFFINQEYACNEPINENEDDPIDFSNGDIFIALDFQPDVQVFQASFYEKMRAHGVDVIFSVYDLFPLNIPELFSSEMLENYDIWLTEVAKADGVICISNSVARDFIEWLDTRGIDTSCRPDIHWLHLVSDIEISSPTVRLTDDFHFLLEKISVATSSLIVSTLEPHKGHAQMLKDLADRSGPCFFR